MNFDEAERMGLAISKSNGYRTIRPKRRPKKTKGHGLKIKWRDKLKKKRHVTPIAVPATPMPDFLSKLLIRRPEARRIQTPEQYAVTRQNQT